MLLRVLSKADNYVKRAQNRDFLHITLSTRIDPETIEQVSKALPPRTCLVVGARARLEKRCSTVFRGSQI